MNHIGSWQCGGLEVWPLANETAAAVIGALCGFGMKVQDRDRHYTHGDAVIGM